MTLGLALVDREKKERAVSVGGPRWGVKGGVDPTFPWVAPSSGGGQIK